MHKPLISCGSLILSLTSQKRFNVLDIYIFLAFAIAFAKMLLHFTYTSSFVNDVYMFIVSAYSVHTLITYPSV